MKPVVLEVVTRMITTFDQCSRCSIVFDQAGLRRKNRQKEFEEYPEDLKEEFAKLSDWLRELMGLYRHRLFIRLIDAQSLMGVYKSLRHRIRRYPSFIIEKNETVSGWDKARVEEVLDRCIKAQIWNSRRQR